MYCEKIFSKIRGNHFKRYITCANYEFKCSVFEIFVNKVIQNYYVNGVFIQYCLLILIIYKLNFNSK